MVHDSVKKKVHTRRSIALRLKEVIDNYQLVGQYICSRVISVHTVLPSPPCEVWKFQDFSITPISCEI